MGAGVTTAILVGALVAVPLVAAPDGNTVATHALSGVVKSVDATMLVITRAGKSPREMTFVLRPTTWREGPIRVGATVQVRFRMEGRSQVATAVLAAARNSTRAQ